ncbi:MAG: FtsX-like permease family protein, partial [Chloroflexota bacterium]|nr:FtsX-like permease family protein [Chloroflexota bacterium]
QISESEGIILGKVELLMGLLAAAAVASSALSVSNLMGATALERSAEVGLLKALGASNASISWLFRAEAALIGVAGGAAGSALGVSLAALIARSVFGTGLEIKPLGLAAAFAIAVGVALAGSATATRMVSRLEPARILVGR